MRLKPPKINILTERLIEKSLPISDKTSKTGQKEEDGDQKRKNEVRP